MPREEKSEAPRVLSSCHVISGELPPTTPRLKRRKTKSSELDGVFSLGKVNVIYGVLLLCKFKTNMLTTQNGRRS